MSHDYVEMPAIGAMVSLAAGEDDSWPVEVIDAVGLRMTLLPAPTVTIAQPPAGAELHLRWADNHGRYGAPVRLREGKSRRGWTVEAVGTVDIDEGRRAARVVAAGPVQIGPVDPELGPLRRANLVDISESGLRCRLPSATELQVGEAASVKLTLGEETLALSARAVRFAPVPVGSGVEVAVEFLRLSEADRNALRSYVLRRRARERELAEDGVG